MADVASSSSSLSSATVNMLVKLLLLLPRFAYSAALRRIFVALFIWCVRSVGLGLSLGVPFLCQNSGGGAMPSSVWKRVNGRDGVYRGLPIEK